MLHWLDQLFGVWWGKSKGNDARAFCANRMYFTYFFHVLAADSCFPIRGKISHEQILTQDAIRTKNLPDMALALRGNSRLRRNSRFGQTPPSSTHDPPSQPRPSSASLPAKPPSAMRPARLTPPSCGLQPSTLRLGRHDGCPRPTAPIPGPSAGIAIASKSQAPLGSPRGGRQPMRTPATSPPACTACTCCRWHPRLRYLSPAAFGARRGSTGTTPPVHWPAREPSLGSETTGRRRECTRCLSPEHAPGAGYTAHLLRVLMPALPPPFLIRPPPPLGGVSPSAPWHAREPAWRRE